MSRLVPILRALVTPAWPGRQAQAHVWCPWCETVHSHSAGPGLRTAHCADRATPFKATGYSLNVVGRTSDANAVMPAGPLVEQSCFRDELEVVAPGLRIALLRHILKRMRATPARLKMVHNAWTIDLDPAAADGGRQLAGIGLLDLVAAAWGVSPGVVVVRLVEALHGWKLDASDRAALVDAVNAAASRSATTAGGAA